MATQQNTRIVSLRQITIPSAIVLAGTEYRVYGWSLPSAWMQERGYTASLQLENAHDDHDLRSAWLVDGGNGEMALTVWPNEGEDWPTQRVPLAVTYA